MRLITLYPQDSGDAEKSRCLVPTAGRKVLCRTTISDCHHTNTFTLLAVSNTHTIVLSQENILNRRDKEGKLMFPHLRTALTSRWGSYAWVKSSSFSLNNHLVVGNTLFRGRTVNDWNIQVRHNTSSTILHKHESDVYVMDHELRCGKKKIVRPHTIMHSDPIYLFIYFCMIVSQSK